MTSGTRTRRRAIIRNLLEVRRVAQEHQLPCLHIVSANQIRPETPIPSPANLQFQAYTTLAAGYRGVTWYNYYGPGYKYTAIDTAGPEDPHLGLPSGRQLPDCGPGARHEPADLDRGLLQRAGAGG